jgi:hypothetical protein
MNNLFIYLDPYGFKSLKFTYFTKLVSKCLNSIEMLLNFNSIGFLREVCRLMNCHTKLVIKDKLEEDYEIDGSLDINKMKGIANGDYWIDIIERFNQGFINFNEAEEELVRNYTSELNKLFKYIIKIPIKSKIKNVPKYRIIFSTNHEDGLILMSEEMNRIWGNILLTDRRNQEVLFDEYELGYDGLNKPKDEIIDILKRNNWSIDFKKLYLELIIKFGFKFKRQDYIKIIKDMENQSVINIKRTPEYNKRNKLNTSFNYKNNDILITLIH